MTGNNSKKTFLKFVIILDYYLAAILLFIAGIFKAFDPSISELLQSLYEHDTLSFQTVIYIARYQHWPEIVLAVTAICGWQALFIARFMGILYLFFTGLILYVSEGYLMLPIDCGCFGTGEGTPVYLLITRNTLIALPLFFYSKTYTDFTLHGFFARRKINSH